jgi:hypothetical protein
MATGHSTRSRPSGRARNTPKIPPHPSQQKKAASTKRTRPQNSKRDERANRCPNRDQILGHFAQALAFIETGYAALNAIEEDWEGDVARSGSPAIRTLTHGIAALGRVYGEVDTALMRCRKDAP